MNAYEFVKTEGLEKAKAVVENAGNMWAYDAVEDSFFDGGDIQDGYSIDHYDGCFLVDDLKQVIADFELVEKMGGLEKAVKMRNDLKNVKTFHLTDNAEQAIQRIEQNTRQIESDNVTDIKNHISPRTLVWDLASGQDWSAEVIDHE